MLKLYALLFLMLTTLAVAGCGNKGNDNSSKDNNVTESSDVNIHNFEIPSNTTEGLSLPNDLSPGSYKVKMVRVTRIEHDSATNGSKWTFIHTFGKPGDPENNDPIVKRGDWTTTDGKIGSTVHQQIPFALTVAEDGGLDYTETTYHGVFMGNSSKKWSWVSSSSESGADIAFLLSSKVISQKEQDSLEATDTLAKDITIAVSDDKGNQVDRKTQIVQKLESNLNTQVVAVKKINDQSFVLINYVTQPKVAEVYTEVTYTK